jgi:hypothetical protein
MHGWTAGRQGIFGGQAHSCSMLFSESELPAGLSSRPLHFCDTVTAAWMQVRMQGNLLLLTDKVVWYSTVQYVRVLTRHHTGGPAGDEMKKQVDGPWHWQ